MLTEVKYETPIENVNWMKPSVFLAGPTVRGNQPHLTSWRPEAVRLFRERNFDGNIIIPEFSDKYESDKYRFDIPVWEFGGLVNSHVILFWIPRTRELIGLTTNHEHGYWMARERTKMIYGRPDDAYRMKYLDIMWVEDCKYKGLPTRYAVIHNTLTKTVDAAIYKLNGHDT